MKTNTIKSIGLIAVIAIAFSSCAPTSNGPVKGCMNSTAVNYDAQATQDDGGCVYIAQKQYSLFYKYTATWCGPCGDWGGPAFVTDCDANPGKILAFTIQCTDDFTNNAASDMYTALSTKWPYGGTPNFQCNNVSLGTNDGGMYSEVTTKNALSPEAGIGIYYTVGAGTNAGKLNINVYMKFFSDVTGEYYAGIYILHKSIIKSQNTSGGMDPTYLHHHVLMEHVSAEFGDIMATDAKAGEVYHIGYVFPYTGIPELDLSKMEVVGIIWKKNGATFDLVNVTPNV